MDEDEVVYVVIGTEHGEVAYVQVVRDPADEHHAIETADKLFKKNKRSGVRVTVWDYTIDKVIYTLPR